MVLGISCESMDTTVSIVALRHHPFSHSFGVIHRWARLPISRLQHLLNLQSMRDEPASGFPTLPSGHVSAAQGCQLMHPSALLSGALGFSGPRRDSPTLGQAAHTSQHHLMSTLPLGPSLGPVPTSLHLPVSLPQLPLSLTGNPLTTGAASAYLPFQLPLPLLAAGLCAPGRLGSTADAVCKATVDGDSAAYSCPGPPLPSWA
ncbi:unnamed protein product, partial [Protopolystoma xenopodis]